MTRLIKNILRVTKDMETLIKDSYCIVESEDEIGMVAENINSLYDTLWHTIEALKKVISNLLANAINYTDEGKRIDIRIVDGRISIENECTPLSQEVLVQIFKAFYRPDFSRNKKDGGTGLGLYIVKDILTHANLSYSFTPSDLGMKFIIECTSSE